MRIAPAVTLAAALAVAAGALCGEARGTTGGTGESAVFGSEQEHEIGADALTRSLRRALHGASIADLDRDGMVSRDEAMRYWSARFARMDRDRDGVVGASEFIDVGLKRAARTMSIGQLARPRDADFSAADLDGNGSLSPEEFLHAALSRKAAERDAARKRARLVVFHDLDLDGDGRISRDDFLGAGAARFTASDPDGDARVPIWQFLAELRF